jgi:dipeptidyl aminopeptidase/acylaminoacyl peptidase
MTTRLIGPPLVALTLAATAAHAQVAANRANWSLADRFAPAALRSSVYTNAVQPRWLGKSDTLWYNWRDRTGSHFYLVVPATGSKRPLFDRERLAAALAEASRRPVDPSNLPFTTLNFTKDHKAFRFTADSMRYEWSLAAGALKSLGRPPRETPPDEERDDRGGRGGGGGGGAQGGARGRDFRNFSPDSSGFVFARNHNLYVVEVGKPDTVQVTTTGALDYTFGFRDTTENRRQLDRLAQNGGQQDENGQGDQTENDDAASRDPRVRPNVTWSPDSKAFSIVRQDQRKVRELYLVNVLADPRPVLLHYRYAMPGEENVPQSELWVYRRGEPAARQLNVARWRDQRVMDVHWPVDGDKVRLVRRDRAQRNLELVEIDAASGATTVLLRESIENASLDPQPVRYLKKGGDFVWWSERSGWGQYYVYDFAGGATPKRALTAGAWHADSVAAIDSTRGVVWLTGMGRETGDNPYFRHLYRVNGDGTGFSLLDPGNFMHAETMSPTRRYFVDSYSRVDAPTKTVLRDAATGKVVMDLEEMDVSRLKELGWKAPERFVVKAADGVTDIYGNMWRPFDFDSTKSYPIIANVYPGPQTESITFNFNPASVPQQLAQLGFVVIQIGNRGGSPQRSLAYHRYGYYNLRDYALADKKAGIEQLAARHRYIDLDRVGIYGHSGGGFLTAAALMLPPYNDFFKVGWSESGNHDNNIYNQNWSEWNHGLKPIVAKPNANGGRTAAAAGSGRDGGTPADDRLEEFATLDTTTSMLDSTRYEIRVPTNIELAQNLKGSLMLTTGDLDNNVHPGGTIRLAQALIKANKRFDFLLVPGQPHAYRDMANYTNRRMLEYFAEKLLGDRYDGAGTK